jgi:hypothetical protein
MDYIESAIKDAANTIAKALSCNHQWKEPEEMKISSCAGLDFFNTVQRCKECNKIRVLGT